MTVIAHIIDLRVYKKKDLFYSNSEKILEKNVLKTNNFNIFVILYIYIFFNNLWRP